MPATPPATQLPLLLFDLACVVLPCSGEAVKQALHAAESVDIGMLPQGLCVIHCCGLVHGDVKPNNMMIDMMVDGSLPHLVITDLGSALKDKSGQHWQRMLTFLLFPAPYANTYRCLGMSDLVHWASIAASVGMLSAAVAGSL